MSDLYTRDNTHTHTRGARYNIADATCIEFNCTQHVCKLCACHANAYETKVFNEQIGNVLNERKMHANIWTHTALESVTYILWTRQTAEHHVIIFLIAINYNNVPKRGFWSMCHIIKMQLRARDWWKHNVEMNLKWWNEPEKNEPDEQWHLISFETTCTGILPCYINYVKFCTRLSPFSSELFSSSFMTIILIQLMCTMCMCLCTGIVVLVLFSWQTMSFQIIVSKSLEVFSHR